VNSPADLGAAAPVRPEHAPSAPTAAPPPVSASAPVAQPAVQLGLQIAAAVPRRIDRLFVRLEPPALGRVEVRLEFSRDNRVSALIAADRHDTLSVLQRDSGTLQRALQDAGMHLGDNGLSFSLRQEQRQPGGGAEGPYPMRVDTAADPAGLTQPSDEARPLYWFGARRVLDIRI
jgi:flagellar hook-length control protein FliK